VLAAHAQAGVMTDAPMAADLAHPVQVLTQLEVEVVGNQLTILAVFEVLLPVEEPVGDLELAGVLDDGDNTVNLFRRQHARALGQVHVGLLQDQVGEAAANTLDGGQRKHGLVAPLNVGVEDTQNVLELSRLHDDRLWEKKNKGDAQTAERIRQDEINMEDGERAA